MKAAFSASSSDAHRDGDGDELGGALAVACDHAREFPADGVDGLLDELERRTRRHRSASPPAAPEASSNAHVVGGRVHVDRDAVERQRDGMRGGRRRTLSLVRGASVVMTASIVAMLGAIMPLPLAMPPTVMRRPPISSDGAVCFANVSVVMIARRRHRRRSGCRAPGPPRGSRAMSLSTGSGTPITPVEETTISSGAHMSGLRPHRLSR